MKSKYFNGLNQFSDDKEKIKDVCKLYIYIFRLNYVLICLFTINNNNITVL